MKTMFQSSTNPYELRNKKPFQTNYVHSVFNGTETISLRGTKIWALVPEEIKKSQSLSEFKTKIRKWKPKGCVCSLQEIYNGFRFYLTIASFMLSFHLQ